MKNIFVWWFTWCIVAMIIVAVPITVALIESAHSATSTFFLISCVIALPIAVGWLAIGIKRLVS